MKKEKNNNIFSTVKLLKNTVKENTIGKYHNLENELGKKNANKFIIKSIILTIIYLILNALGLINLQNLIGIMIVFIIPIIYGMNKNIEKQELIENIKIYITVLVSTIIITNTLTYKTY